MSSRKRKNPPTGSPADPAKRNQLHATTTSSDSTEPSRSQHVDPSVQAQTPSNIDWNGSYDTVGKKPNTNTPAEQAEDLKRTQGALDNFQTRPGYDHITHAVIE
jgi:hypothetical protein